MLLSKDKIIFLIVAVAITFFLLIIFFISVIIYNIRVRKQKEISNLKQLLQVQEDERKRIAEDLHDDFGPLLALIKLQVGFLINEDKSTEEKEVLDNVNKYVETALVQMRSVVRTLLPINLAKQGLIKIIEEESLVISKTSNISLLFTPPKSFLRLNQNAELNIYRIIHELITNSIKHSGCSTIYLNVKPNDQQLEIYYRDNGTKVNHANVEGLGSKNIRLRINLLKGILEEDRSFAAGANYKIVFANKFIS